MINAVRSSVDKASNAKSVTTTKRRMTRARRRNLVVYLNADEVTRTVRILQKFYKTRPYLVYGSPPRAYTYIHTYLFLWILCEMYRFVLATRGIGRFPFRTGGSFSPLLSRHFWNKKSRRGLYYILTRKLFGRNSRLEMKLLAYLNLYFIYIVLYLSYRIIFKYKSYYVFLISKSQYPKKIVSLICIRRI